MHDLFSILANVFIVTSMGIYITRLIKGTTTAEPIAWLIGCIAMLLQNITGYSLVNKNLQEMKFGIALNLCLLFIFVYSSVKGTFKKPTPINTSILVLALLIAVFRQIVHDDRIANISVQFLFILSMIPTIQGMLDKTLVDHYLPWLLGVIAYGFQILTVVTNPEGWTFYALVFPVITGVIGNGTITFTAWWMMNKQKAFNLSSA